MDVPLAADVRLRVRAGMQTDVGRIRANNEDSAYVDPGGRFVLLADGMGGAGAGEVASAIAVEAARAELEAAAAALGAFEAAPSLEGRSSVRAIVERAAQRAHDAVIERARVEPDKRGMGSTLDVVVVTGGEAFVAHVGDSRTYLIREGATTRVTSDQTVAQALVTAGALTEHEAEKSPLRSVLASGIGLSHFRIDHAHVELVAGDRLLICSDGLHGYFTDEDLARRLSIAELGVALAGLVDEARERGGADNITGIVVDVYSLAAGPVAGVPADALATMVDTNLAEDWPITGDDELPSLPAGDTLRHVAPPPPSATPGAKRE
jgi:PPM family protein phosphatase